MASSDINLLKQDVHKGAAFPELEEKLRLAAWWGLVGLLATGVIVATGFFVLSARVTQLEQQNQRLSQQVSAQSVKEGILISLKQRTDIAGKALDAARPWGNLFPILTQIADQTAYRTLTVDEAGKVSVVVKVISVDDAAVLVSNIIGLTQAGQIKLPQLLSFAVSEDASVQMGITFVPVL